MNVEREVLVTILKLTKNAPIHYSLVGKNARIPTQISEGVLRKLADGGLVRWKGKVLEVSSGQRVRIAVQAMKLGADFQRVCTSLEWREFESISTKAFEAYNFNVKKNFRFKAENGKRWEIDLVACKQPIVASVDCKHWKQNWTKAPVMKVVEEHVERTRALADTLARLRAKIDLSKWRQATVIPVVLSLLPGPFKFCGNTPVVPVLQVQTFLSEMPAHINLLTHFSKTFTNSAKEITEY